MSVSLSGISVDFSTFYPEYTARFASFQKYSDDTKVLLVLKQLVDSWCLAVDHGRLFSNWAVV